MQISRSVKAVVGVVLAAVVIGFTNPKAVHAVTAALVQVTNTASNPVVTQSVGAQAGNMVHLACSFVLQQVNTSCSQVSADGKTTAGYSVPAGELLVITAVDLARSPDALGGLCQDDVQISLLSSTGPLSVMGPTTNSLVMSVTVPNTVATTHFTYPSGLVMSGGVMLQGGPDTVSSGIGSCPVYETANIYGYLTAV